MKLTLQIEYHTSWGQQLYIGGAGAQLGNWDVDKALPLNFMGDGLWSVDLKPKKGSKLTYKYLIKSEGGYIEWEYGSDRSLKLEEDTQVRDSWRSASHQQNVLNSSPFEKAFFGPRKTKKAGKKTTGRIEFNLNANRIAPTHSFCITGNCKELGNWDDKKAVILDGSDYPKWKRSLDIDSTDELEYKYGIYDPKNKQIVTWESGENRKLSLTNTGHIVNDEYFNYPDDWKGAGVAIPVFSLRSEQGLGVGEFSDLKLLVDWSSQVGLKLIQVLPVNDTVATHTWVDSYPYAAISVFALHPIYASLDGIGRLKDDKRQAEFDELRKELNALETVDYERVLKAKSRYFKLKFDEVKKSFLKSKEFKLFFDRNNQWLVPYAAFSYLRDKNGTPDFNQWGKFKTISPKQLNTLVDEENEAYDDIAIHYFIQFHLDKQLTEATDYARSHGVVLKGDIPIGIYRYSVDAWVAPELYNMDGQSGAPPDAFSASGQNWGFPTYNWDEMAKDDYAWWKERLSKMADYFDVFRIDHILGFFRIWEIPWHAVEGTLGRFNPSLPYGTDELNQWGINFNYDRMCRPYIRDYMIDEIFGGAGHEVRSNYLEEAFPGVYQLKIHFDTQRKIKEHFEGLAEYKGNQSHYDFLKYGLLRLAREVIFLEAPLSNGQAFNPNIDLTSTYSYRDLDDGTKAQLNEMHRQFFFHRHNEFWRGKAMEKLPALKEATDMLVCGEDLGMVPDSVPGVMNELQILSLAVQRMPNDNSKEFWHPADTPYLSVCSTGSHDTSTLRQWWEEDREKTQRFYNHILGNGGEAPFYCEPWVAEQVIVQHLYSPSMWAIFPIQDLMALDGELRRVFPQDEHINHPEIIPHYWKYRFHLTLEELTREDEFNSHLKDLVIQSGRG